MLVMVSTASCLRIPPSLTAHTEGYYAAGLANRVRPDHDNGKDMALRKTVLQSPGPPPYTGTHPSPNNLSPGISPTTPGFRPHRASATVSRLSAAFSRLSGSTDGGWRKSYPVEPVAKENVAPQQLDSTEIGAVNGGREFAAELPATEWQPQGQKLPLR